MPDPYRSRGSAAVHVTEVRSPLDQFLLRLRELGATGDEQDAVAMYWDQLDPDDDPDPDAWTAKRRASVAAADDAEVRGFILAVREDWEIGTTSEDQAARDVVDQAYEAASAEAVGRVGGTIPHILEWVGDDKHRAAAVYDLEDSPEGAHRKTLLAELKHRLEA